MIHQRVNYILDRFTSESIVRSWEQFPNQLIAPRTNAWAILKADNNNNYNYDQASGEK